MCEIYVKAEPMLYESRARSVHIHGLVTKIRLENLFWDILAELAGNEQMTTNQLIAKLYDEIIEFRGEVENFASFLRVTCLRYLTLRHQKEGERPSQAVISGMPTLLRPRSLAAA